MLAKRPPFYTRLNRSDVFAKGLKLSYLFNENNGTIVNDLSGNQGNGVLTNSPTWEPGGVNFDADTEHIESANGSILQSKGTIAFSYKYNGTVTSYNYYFVLEDDYQEFSIFQNVASGGIQLNINGTVALTVTTNDHKDGKPHIIVVTWNDSTNYTAIYIDGILYQLSTTAFTWDAAGMDDHNLCIGGRKTGTVRFSAGIYGFFHAWNYDLSPSIIKDFSYQPYRMFLRRSILPCLYISGSSPVTGTVSESESIGEIQSITAIFTPSISESETIDDNNSAVSTLLSSTTESETINDNNSASSLSSSIISESESIGDVTDAEAINLGSVVESVGINDSQSCVIVASVSISESESIGEIQSTTAIFTPSVSESETIDDNNSAVSTLLSSASESESIGDVTDAEASNLGEVVESTPINDAQSNTMIGVASTVETESIDSDQSVIGTFPVSVAESSSISDITNAGKLSTDLVSESEAIGDVSDAVVVMEASVTETTAANDTCNGSIEATGASTSESTPISDTSSATVIYATTIVESESIDGVAICLGIFIAQVNESSPISDTPSIYEVATFLTAAEILRALIVEEAIGVLRSLSPTGEWPVYVSHMPNNPDNSICVYDTAGIPEGRIQRTGESIGKPGWQVRVRSIEFRDGMDKIHEIADCFDSILRYAIIIDTITYNIQSVDQKTTILPLGQNNDDKRRYHFTLNGTVTYS